MLAMPISPLANPRPSTTATITDAALVDVADEPVVTAKRGMNMSGGRQSMCKKLLTKLYCKIQGLYLWKAISIHKKKVIYRQVEI